MQNTDFEFFEIFPKINRNTNNWINNLLKSTSVYIYIYIYICIYLFSFFKRKITKTNQVFFARIFSNTKFPWPVLPVFFRINPKSMAV